MISNPKEDPWFQLLIRPWHPGRSNWGLTVPSPSCLEKLVLWMVGNLKFFGKTSTPFFSILSIPSYTICNKQYTICNSRAYFPLPRLVFDGWRLLSEALFCNRTTCPLITRLRLSQLFCPLLNNWYTFQIDDQNKDKNRQLTNIGYSCTLPWLKNCSVA